RARHDPRREPRPQVPRRPSRELDLACRARACRNRRPRRRPHRGPRLLRGAAERRRRHRDLLEPRPVTTRLAACVLFAAAFAVAPLRAQQAPPAGDEPRSGSWVVSIEHLRAELAKPPSKLTLQDRVPDFTVHIEKRPPMADIFDT